MSQTEIKNVRAKCIDMNNPAEIVLHEVYFDIKESGDDWKRHSVQIMATDPLDAIAAVRQRTM